MAKCEICEMPNAEHYRASGPLMGLGYCASCYSGNRDEMGSIDGVISAAIARRAAAKGAECVHEWDPFRDCLKCGISEYRATGKVSVSIPVATLDEVQERVPAVVDEYDGHGMEQCIEERLLEAMNALADSVAIVRSVRTGKWCEAESYYANGVSIADFRREAPALLAELVREVAKL